jgi:hypothetical protein
VDSYFPKKRKIPWKDLYRSSLKDVEEAHPVSAQQLALANDELTEKYFPRKSVKWYPVFADQPNSYQADLMFEKISNSKGIKILQALLCVININTRYAFVVPVQYTVNYKKEYDSAWTPDNKTKNIPVSNKEAGKVLNALKDVIRAMRGEQEILNDALGLENEVVFKMDRLYTDEGGEFKGVFHAFLENPTPVPIDNGEIAVDPVSHFVFKKSEGSKRRMSIVERFIRTFRRLLEKQKVMNPQLTRLVDRIPEALDLYNRYLNHRSIETFLRHLEGNDTFEDSERRFFPAMMMFPGIEEKYIEYMRKRFQDVEEFYSGKINEILDKRDVKYFKRNWETDIFGKAGGSTLKAGNVSQRNDRGPSFKFNDTTQKYLPYEIVLPTDSRPVKKLKK